MKRLFVLASASVIALALAGCSGIASVSDYESIQGPEFGTNGATFRPVSRVMEARCGTLDCHGEMSRPMRIFGQQGLRMPLENPPPGYTTAGSEGTTTEELLANYAAMVGIEPEKIDLVVAGKARPDTLTLVRKPRLTEKHKGGKIWSQNDPGDACLIKWLDDVSVPGSKPRVLDTRDCDKELTHF